MAWSPDDQAKALAWQRETRLRCQKCGTAEWEWMEYDDDGKLVDRSVPPYETVLDRCRGCSAMDARQASISEATRIAGVDGLYVRLVRRLGGRR